ncbi:hypothetical protein M758_11G066800 [Ceratodon purpureus]|nr:hypothetical protein M758_11G066800 [Ceratodon purpureus]
MCPSSRGWLGSAREGKKMVGAATMLSRTTRPSHRSKHQYFVEERVGGNRISPAATLGMPPQEFVEAIQHPSEPVDLDQPARCPPPEGNIMRDGEIWREMLAGRRRHQMEKGWDEGDAAGSRTGIPPRRRVQHSPREKYLFMKHSAPERAVGTIVE